MRIYRRRVAGTGRAEVFVSDRMRLDEPALEILEWRKTVLVTAADGLHGSVLLAGRVRTRCLYITPGPAGRVLVHVAEIPFQCRARVPGARPGMTVKVTEAYVTADASEAAVCDSGGLIRSVRDRSLVKIHLRVVQPEFGRIHTAQPVAVRRRKPKAAKKTLAAPKPQPKPPRRPKPQPKPPDAPPRPPGVWVHPDVVVPTT